MTPSGCSSWARVLPVPCGSNGLRYAPKARFWRLRIDDARQTNTFTSQCQTKSNFAIVFIWGQFGLFLSRVEWLRACDFGVRVMSFIWIECFRLLLVSVFMAIVVDGGSEISFHLPLWASKYLQTGHRWKWSSGNSLVDHEKKKIATIIEKAIGWAEAYESDVANSGPTDRSLVQLPFIME